MFTIWCEPCHFLLCTHNQSASRYFSPSVNTWSSLLIQNYGSASQCRIWLFSLGRAVTEGTSILLDDQGRASIKRLHVLTTITFLYHFKTRMMKDTQHNASNPKPRNHRRLMILSLIESWLKITSLGEWREKKAGELFMRFVFEDQFNIAHEVSR